MDFYLFSTKINAMDKRTFLKLSSALMTGTLFGNLSSCNPEKPAAKLKNWSGNLTYSTSNLLEPETVEDVVRIVKDTPKFRVLGTRHCFNQIANSKDNLLSTSRLNKVISIDSTGYSVTLESGVRYGELCQQLHEKGFAIHNLASLPHISVAGACATATHGSGIKNGNLATAIKAIEFISGTGEVVNLSRDKDGDTFHGSVVGLGSLGVVTKVTLDIMPTFLMAQEVYLDLPHSQLEQHFEEIIGAGYSVSLFTDWQSDKINQVWIKRVVTQSESIEPAKEFFGATLAPRNVHPIIEISAENCTDQMSVPGPWYERLPHFKMGFTPSSGEELQAEYFVPMDQAVEAIKAVNTLKDEIGPLLFISEIRTIDADNFWMSPCYHRPSVAIHFTLKQNNDGVQKLLPKIEEKLAPFNVRPHWGKLFTIPPATLQARYERIGDFRELVERYDPAGKFRNDFINNNIFGS
jgi:xylitol oxidase